MTKKTDHKTQGASAGSAPSTLLGPDTILPPCPEYREMIFQVQVTEPMVECINLLSQVMRSYPELKPKGQQTVAAWFRKAYGDDCPNEKGQR